MKYNLSFETTIDLAVVVVLFNFTINWISLSIVTYLYRCIF
ncbi:hypothetical protein SNUCP4_30740 [Clostridium perfringens A]